MLLESDYKGEDAAAIDAQLQIRQRQAGANFIVAYKGLLAEGLSMEKALKKAQQWAWDSTGLDEESFPVVSLGRI